MHRFAAPPAPLADLPEPRRTERRRRESLGIAPDFVFRQATHTRDAGQTAPLSKWPRLENTLHY